MSTCAHYDLVEDTVEWFRELPAFTFAFTGDNMCGFGPSLASAVEMVWHVYNGLGDLYHGPLPESQYADARTEAVGMHAEITAAVAARVQQFRDAGVSFVMCWHAVGDEPNLVYSDDLAEDEGCAALVDALQHELGSQILM
jgi:hypothetical protein